MRVRIHRGAHEIRGNCIEIEQGQDRIVLDLARLVDAFDSARVVPIHSESTDRFADHFPRSEEHANHEWWEV